MKKDDIYLPFCGGSSLKYREIKINLPLDIDFRLKFLAGKEGKTLEEYIALLLKKEAKKLLKPTRIFTKNCLKNKKTPQSGAFLFYT